MQVSNMLLPSESPQQKVEISESVLLCLYEAVHLNRNFITVLTHVRVGFAFTVYDTIKLQLFPDVV